MDMPWPVPVVPVPVVPVPGVPVVYCAPMACSRQKTWNLGAQWLWRCKEFEIN